MRNIVDHYCVDGVHPKVANFLTVYIEEAHAKDEWSLENKFYDSYITGVGKATTFDRHKSMMDRIRIAKAFQLDLNFPGELVCDSFSNPVKVLYDGWPERLYIIESGVIVYQGGYGPFDYNLKEVQEYLYSRFGSRGPIISKD
jgi:hypothetical protein